MDDSDIISIANGALGNSYVDLGTCIRFEIPGGDSEDDPETTWRDTLAGILAGIWHWPQPLIDASVQTGIVPKIGYVIGGSSEAEVEWETALAEHAVNFWQGEIEEALLAHFVGKRIEPNVRLAEDQVGLLLELPDEPLIDPNTGPQWLLGDDDD